MYVIEGSKRHVGIFHVTTRLEFSDGAGGTLDIPVKFKITRDGTSSIECQAVMDSLQTDVISLAPELQQLNRRLLKTATAVTDNCPAAKCTRKLLAEKKHDWMAFDELDDKRIIRFASLFALNGVEKIDQLLRLGLNKNFSKVFAMCRPL